MPPGRDAGRSLPARANAAEGTAAPVWGDRQRARPARAVTLRYATSPCLLSSRQCVARLRASRAPRPLCELRGLGGEVVDLTERKQTAADAHRERFTDVVAPPVLRERLKVINPRLEDDQVEEGVRQLAGGYRVTPLPESVEPRQSTGVAMDDPEPPESLFRKKPFRIPDCRRGCAWGRGQVDACREDLVNLPDGRSHHAGMLTRPALLLIPPFPLVRSGCDDSVG